MVLASRRAPGPRPSLGLRARGAWWLLLFLVQLSLLALGEHLFVDLARSPQLPLVDSTDGRRPFPNQCRPVRYAGARHVQKLDPG